MSNVDTLLDLGDASAPPQDTNQTNPPNLLDPFDQLAPSTESLSPQKTPDQTDLLGSFDPFSSTTMSSATNGDAAIDASLSTDQVKTMEQEFDDLLGGFSSTTPTETVTNGTTDEPVVHLDEDLGESSTTDDIVTVTQKTTSVDGETVITETRTETLSDGRTLIETSSVTEKETESAIDSNGLENGEQAEAEKKMSTSSDKELRLSSTSESTPEVKSLEESLPDYQPPKRNVKKEERKPSRGPSTFIADSASTNGPETPKLSKVTQSDTTAEYDIKPSTPFKSLLASFGTPKGGGSENQCKACGKRVYEMEKMIADKAIYHKMCFKCAKCNRICSLGNFAAMDGQIFCKPHFISMFKTKGNYDEGFGREKHTKQWANRNSSPATFQGLVIKGERAKADGSQDRDKTQEAR